jgi:hypothetical protein
VSERFKDEVGPATGGARDQRRSLPMRLPKRCVRLPKRLQRATRRKLQIYRRALQAFWPGLDLSSEPYSAPSIRALIGELMEG